jgi:hypothetical protein
MLQPEFFKYQYKLLDPYHEIKEKHLALMVHLAEDLIDSRDRQDNVSLYFGAEPPGRGSVHMAYGNLLPANP